MQWNIKDMRIIAKEELRENIVIIREEEDSSEKRDGKEYFK